MTREQHRTPYQDVVALSSKVHQLFEQALPEGQGTALFNRLAAEAKAQGLTWIENLEYVVEQKHARP